ncbi:saccharopine dehydrogenase-like NADP-dependent oxidoreductase [Sinobacterium caligoides]|uniref:Saccharopine dehydrogenase-like NADP-dependent oxidoreductase n=1 Tax=Sinobacterium caligoides TaxID=933926 RepID=A0A3N2DQH9_9GAMM|nr:saccharopine dehydrogenase NADP-binding domain-containing protein [Sinobacterium caligoides]ROS02050.1 saccharopine dehydrogenase-like NADP-dependent oxidoreductase [Sinobacterium caligoides]
MDVRRVLILGGYGNFGKRIAESLSSLQGITVVIAGRDAEKAARLCAELSAKNLAATLEAAVVDTGSAQFVEQLRALSTDLVIHTGGPFQGQDYRVAEACLQLGNHYIDLADDRRFVCDISQLDKQARDKGLLLVSGASSVPGLSSTVVEHFIDQFSRLDAIDFAIAPGNQAERGEATVSAILSYTGKPFSCFQQGRWFDQYGWMSPRKLDFGDVVGRRWLANIDIPDLQLFPEYYPSVHSVRFQAGLELPLLHFGMVLMAWLSKRGIVKDWSAHTPAIVKASEWFLRLGSDIGGMRVNLSGLGTDHKPLAIDWLLSATDGMGPYIPTISAIILAKKLIAGTIEHRGAMPCMGLYTLAEFDHEALPLGIVQQTEQRCG